MKSAKRHESSGRPRDPALDRAVLTAAADLLAENGYRALTMDAVAARAGTSKTAIYRRWDAKTSLVVDLLAERLPAPTPQPDTGSPGGNLIEAGRQLADALADPAVRHGLTGLLAEAAGDPAITVQIRQRLVQPQLAAAEESVTQAHAAGLIPAWMTTDLIADVFTGAILQRVLVRGEPPDPTFLGALAMLITSAAGMPPSEDEHSAGKPPNEDEHSAGKPPSEDEHGTGMPPSKGQHGAGDPRPS